MGNILYSFLFSKLCLSDKFPVLNMASGFVCIFVLPVTWPCWLEARQRIHNKITDLRPVGISSSQLSKIFAYWFQVSCSFVMWLFFPWKPQGLQVSNVLMELIQDQIWLFASNGDDYM